MDKRFFSSRIHSESSTDHFKRSIACIASPVGDSFSVTHVFDASKEVLSLSSFVGKYPRTPTTVKGRIAIEVVSGLRFLENLNLVHFDLSPHTVMVRHYNT